MKRKRLGGSYTVEAAFLFPIIVLLAAFFLQTAISLYRTVDEAAADIEELRQMETVELFLKENAYED